MTENVKAQRVRAEVQSIDFELLQKQSGARSVSEQPRRKSEKGKRCARQNWVACNQYIVQIVKSKGNGYDMK